MFKGRDVAVGEDASAGWITKPANGIRFMNAMKMRNEGTTRA